MGILSAITAAGRAAARELGLAAPVPNPAQERAMGRRVAVPGPYWDRDPAMLGNVLTPRRLTSIIAERNEGYLQSWADLADECIEHDPHLFSQLTIRAQSVVETEFSVVPGAGSNQRAAARAAKFCEELVTHWQTREGEGGGLEDWLHEWVWGKFYGRSLHELLWERDGGVIYAEGLAGIDARRLSLACDSADPDPWALRIWDADGVDQTPFAGMYGRRVSEFGPDKFLPFQPRVRGSQPTREGLFSIAAWYELFRTCSWRELMALEEQVSRPPVIAYYNAGGAKADGAQQKFNGDRQANQTERDAAARAVYAPTGALRAVLPDTVRVEALKYSLPTTDPVPILTSRECDALISKAINGVANLSDLKAGARAAVEAQERTSFTFWRADCRSVERLVGRIFARIVRANPQRFGEECPVPRYVAKTQPPKDTKAAGERIDRARGMGLKVPRKWAHQELEIPEAKPGEEVLEAPAPPPARELPARDGAKGDAPYETPPTTPDVKASAVALAAGASSSGVIVCLVPPADVAQDLALPGGEAADDLHVTLVHLGDASAMDEEQRQLLAQAAKFFARWLGRSFAPLAGAFNGVARFSAPDGTDAAVLTLDAPWLSLTRERFVSTLTILGFDVSGDHGFVPHMTRAYVARGEALPGGDAIEPVPVLFDTIALWCGGERFAFPLSATKEPVQ